MKIGIIGLGNIWKCQQKALKTVTNYEIKAVCDIDLNKQEEINDNEIAFYSDYKEMIKQEELDCILISTPPATHYEIIMNALSFPVNILVEKPIILDLDKLHDLYSIDRQDKILMTAFHASFAEDVLWFKNNCLSMIREYGEILSIESYFYDPYVTDGSVLEKAIPLGGSWIDSGVNALSVIAQIIDIERIKSINVSKNVDYNSKIDTFSIGAYKFESNDKKTFYNGYIKTDWTLNKNHKSTMITFSKNNTKLILNHSEQAVDIVIRDKKERLFEANRFERLQQHYINLFNDFSVHVNKHEDNKVLTLKIHELLLGK